MCLAVRPKTPNVSNGYKTLQQNTTNQLLFYSSLWLFIWSQAKSSTCMLRFTTMKVENGDVKNCNKISEHKVGTERKLFEMNKIPFFLIK